jgi:plastocyanin
MFRSMVVVIGAAIALVLAISIPAVAAKKPQLVGTVGPGFTIKLTMSGKRVKSIKAGTYVLVVRDKASIHNFVLEQSKGGKFEKTVTGVSFVGTKKLKVRLTRGTWEFYCAPHEPNMHGEFTVR